MVIYEKSASIKVIRYSCVNIHGLEIIWTFIAFEKPSLIGNTSFGPATVVARSHKITPVVVGSSSSW